VNFGDCEFLQAFDHFQGDQLFVTEPETSLALTAQWGTVRRFLSSVAARVLFASRAGAERCGFSQTANGGLLVAMQLKFNENEAHNHVSDRLALARVVGYVGFRYLVSKAPSPLATPCH
jgi:hypothetical protein